MITKYYVSFIEAWTVKIKKLSVGEIMEKLGYRH